jgi:hypothetical protein
MVGKAGMAGGQDVLICLAAGQQDWEPVPEWR